MKKSLYILFITIFIFSGCATNTGPEYSGKDYSKIKRYELGVVVEARPVVISDDGSGNFLGVIIGAVLGSTVGKNTGRLLATLGGGLIGGYAGKEISKANGIEITVELDSGEDIVAVIKGKDITAGDRVKLIIYNNKVEQVYKVD